MLKKFLFIISLALLILSGVLIYTNRQDARRQAAIIEAADQKGADVKVDLAKLKSFSASHMYSSVTVTLNGSYTRAQAAAAASAAAANTSAQIYAAAQKACSGKSDSIVQAQCNAQYLSTHLANLPSSTPVSVPQPSEFQYKFVSPLWTADLAGVLLLAGLLVGGWWLVGMLTRRTR